MLTWQRRALGSGALSGSGALGSGAFGIGASPHSGTPSSHISLAAAWSQDPATHGASLTTTYPRDAGNRQPLAPSAAAASALQDYKAKAKALRAREFELERSLRALSKYSATASLP